MTPLPRPWIVDISSWFAQDLRAATKLKEELKRYFLK